jgi:hypothetical protein
MSTQKRESRRPPATETCRPGLRFRRQGLSCTERAREWGRIFSTPFARYGCAGAGEVTAPPLLTLRSVGACFHSGGKYLSPGAPEQLATKFLHADLKIGQHARPIFKAERTAAPPFRAFRPHIRFGAFGAPVSPRSSLPHIPFSSGPTRLHLTLPQAPAAYQRRAERYDGKRDLYFLNAA